MTISTLAFSLLECVLPLKWLAGNHPKSRYHTAVVHKSPTHAAQNATSFVASDAYRTRANALSPLQPTPLRIVRVIERGHSRGNVGRMVISGRMADVCAELDRLAACEAA